MRHVDALSRYPAINVIEDGIVARIRNAQQEDEKCQLVRNILQTGEYKNFVIRNSLLYVFEDGDCVLVVLKVMQKEIIRSVQEKGHIAAQKCDILIKKEYWIKDLKKKVNNVISNCIHCILAVNKQGGQKRIFELHRKTRCSIVVFVVVDAFIKFVWIYPVKNVTTEETIQRL